MASINTPKKLMFPAFSRHEYRGSWEVYTGSDALAIYVLEDRPLVVEDLKDTHGPAVKLPSNAAWVVTSPNETHILNPPIGIRDVHAFSDGHYGFDDRSRYPQFFTSKFEHYACIPKRCPQLDMLWWVPKRSDCPLVPGVVDKDIRVLNPEALAKLRPYKQKYYEQVHEFLQTHNHTLPALLVTSMEHCFARLSMGMSYRSLVSSIADFQRAALDCHGFLNYFNVYLPRTMTIEGKAAEPGLVGRWGSLEASRVEQEGSESCVRNHDTDHSLMGAFTHNLDDAQTLLHMGIPVWLIRPSIDIPPKMNVAQNANVDKLQTTPNTTDAPIVTDEFYSHSNCYPYSRVLFPYPRLYRGPPGTAMQEALQRVGCRVSGRDVASTIGTSQMNQSEEGYRHVRAVELMPYVVYQLPGTSVDSDGELQAEASSPRAGGSDAPSSSNSAANDTSAEAGIDLPRIPSWSDALQALPSHTARAASSLLQGSLLPPPSSFLTTSNRKLYLGGWLACRAVYIANAFENLDSAGGFPNTQQWRNFLNTMRFHFQGHGGSLAFVPSDAKRRRIKEEVLARTGEGSSSGHASGSGVGARVSRGGKGGKGGRGGKGSKDKQPGSRQSRGRTVHPFFEDLTLRSEKVSRVAWLEKQLLVDNREAFEREMSEDVVSEILWELHELNFRLELLLLDQHILPGVWTKALKSDVDERRRTLRELQLRSVFPLVDGEHSDYFVKAIPNVNRGLASYDWKERARHVLALRNVILKWPGCPEDIVKGSLKMEEFQMAVMENMVVGWYCRVFQEKFGRPPVPPVRLPASSLLREGSASFYGSLFAGPQGKGA